MHETHSRLDAILKRLNHRFTIAEGETVFDPTEQEPGDGNWEYYLAYLSKIPMILFSLSGEIRIEMVSADELEDGNKAFSAALWLNPIWDWDTADENEDEMFRELVSGLRYHSDSSEQDWQDWFVHEGNTPEEALEGLVNFLNDFFPIEQGHNMVRYVLEYESGTSLVFHTFQPLTHVMDMQLNTLEKLDTELAFFDESKPTTFRTNMQFPFSKGVKRIYAQHYTLNFGPDLTDATRYTVTKTVELEGGTGR